MSKQTYRRFDPWRSTPIQEEARETIVGGHYFNIDRVSLTSPTVGHFERLILHKNNGDSVGVIGLTKDGRVPLIEQYRIPVHRWTLEIPAGHAVDKGERPIDVAHRKLAEEVGYKAGVMTQFCRFINTPSYSTQHTALYFAYDLEPIDEREQYANEARAQVRFLTPQECYELVLNGTILDAKTVLLLSGQGHHPHPAPVHGAEPYDRCFPVRWGSGTRLTRMLAHKCATLCCWSTEYVRQEYVIARMCMRIWSAGMK